ncbi:wax ester/triacylglycerol synthase family O-acyltransferase [Lentzea sp. BCCO 10_0798]|uniref:Wax ester/triacylglycerol synthase family O-acyltransferase n=1 Tax=Lentzea kristufekii TaxID=3095430 RepID=A0ABU4TQJ8_9PSEU|nr:wax ester/triacylglycerol synthase domain-containing protein [Lentzea sp. BCCO 10_0798]MDX8050555.1 wax ester/triacylglycerol synthase family O-acyltransferase [Lentzea sp. BCCO 10_0798]
MDEAGRKARSGHVRPPRSGRPLWSATSVTGLAEARGALVIVFHHVLADGIGDASPAPRNI